MPNTFQGLVSDEKYRDRGVVRCVSAACVSVQVSNNGCRVSLLEMCSLLYPFHHHLLKTPPSLQHFTGELVCSRGTSLHK